VIEGLRVLPWFQDALKDNADVMPLPCNECIERVDPVLRQHMGCAFLPPVEGAVVWDAEGKVSPPPTTCPRYTTSLPDVADIVRAWQWHEKGELAVVAPAPSQALLDGVELFSDAMAVWRDTRPKKGGAS
jgi:hypothetical protein